jgi:hypothetical protein
VTGKRRKVYKEENIVFLPFPKYYLGDQVEKDMGGAYSTYGGKERCKQIVVVKREGKGLKRS